MTPFGKIKLVVPFVKSRRTFAECRFGRTYKASRCDDHRGARRPNFPVPANLKSIVEPGRRAVATPIPQYGRPAPIRSPLSSFRFRGSSAPSQSSHSLTLSPSCLPHSRCAPPSPKSSKTPIKPRISPQKLISLRVAFPREIKCAPEPPRSSAKTGRRHSHLTHVVTGQFKTSQSEGAYSYQVVRCGQGTFKFFDLRAALKHQA